VPKLPIHFEEILSLAHGNCEEQNKVLEFSIIIINYCTFIINTHYCIINVQYNYISKEALLEECDKEQNVAVTGAATTSCLKGRF
jgi:hypothetical protein